MRLGLDEVDDQSPQQIGGEEEPKGRTLRMRTTIVLIQHEGQRSQEEDFIQLSWVTRNTIAEINRPRHGGWRAVGIIGESGKETSYSSNGDTQAQRNHEEIAGTGADMTDSLDKFNRDPASE